MTARFKSASVMMDLGARLLVTLSMVRSMKTLAEPMGMPMARASMVSSCLSLVGLKSAIIR